MNFLKRRKFLRHENFVVSAAALAIDRPTDLKETLLSLGHAHPRILEEATAALEIYQGYPTVQNDVRLATLRTICSENPEMVDDVVSRFPELRTDQRALESIEFYQQKSADKILGITSSHTMSDFYIPGQNPPKKKLRFDHDAFEGLKQDAPTINQEDYKDIISLTTSNRRTLSQLKDLIQNAVNRTVSPLTPNVALGILCYLTETGKTTRNASDFFVCSLRVFGESSPLEGLSYGDKVLPVFQDHRALRSMAVFLRREHKYEDALRILRHPAFQHDDKTRGWLMRLQEQRRHKILDNRLRPEFEKFGEDFESLSRYIDDIYESLKSDYHVAGYMYSFLRDLYEKQENQFLANELIRWGDAIAVLKAKRPDIQTKEFSKIDLDKFSDKSYERILRELRRLEDSVSLRLGNHITSAARSPLRVIGLPFTLPILTIKLGLQKIGKTKTPMTVVPRNASTQRKNCIVLFPTNGVGFGHFTRMYASARALRRKDPSLEIVFFTPMPTLHVLYADNFPTYHLAGRYKHSDMSARQWNGLVEEFLTLVFEMHAPKWFMFDGSFPYRGMLNAIQAQNGMEKIWMQRGTFKKNKKLPNGTVELFDLIIRPQDTVSDPVPSMNFVTREVSVSPITLINPDEMLERNKARAALSVSMDCTLVYVQLGAGRINDITSTVRTVIDELLKHRNVHVVLGESLLGERAMLGIDRLTVVRDYPNALFLKAFDASVQAGGYNSFHEMRSIKIPTLFIPNEKTGMDDQVKRVSLSVEEGWGVVCRSNQTEISDGVETLLSMKRVANPPLLVNGANEVATEILSTGL